MVQAHHNLNLLLGVAHPTAPLAPYRLNGPTHTGGSVRHHTHCPELASSDFLVDDVAALELLVTDLATFLHLPSYPLL